jgi:hypothetical protein
MTKMLHLLLTALLLVPCFANADRILRVLAPYGLEDPPHILTDEGWIVIPYSTNRRGPEIRPAHANKIVLGREAPDSTAEEPVFVTVFEAPIPAGGSEYLLLLTARRNRQLSGAVIDDTPEKYPPGSIRFVNTIGIPIRVQLSDHQADLEHLQQTMTRISESDFERLTVRAGAYVNGQPRILFNQRRMIRADLRYLLIAFVGDEEQIEIHWLRER